MRIMILNGPNLNLLGIREPHIYGTTSLNELNTMIKNKFPEVEFTFYQSNCEGTIIDHIQECILNRGFDGLVINPAAYTHYSIAIRDALAAITIPKVEVHLSDYTKREEFRKISITKDACNSTFYGEGVNSYIQAVMYIRGVLDGKSEKTN